MNIKLGLVCFEHKLHKKIDFTILIEAKTILTHRDIKSASNKVDIVLMEISSRKKAGGNLKISKLYGKTDFIGRSSESFNQFTRPFGQIKESLPFFSIKDRRRIKALDIVLIENFKMSAHGLSFK